MNFSESISSCMSKYATFTGRASRSEFWWFYLFTFLVQWGAIIAGGFQALIYDDGYIFEFVQYFVSLVFLLPSLAVMSRRLHDIDKSGWWILLIFTVIGVIPLIIWWVTETKYEDNRFGNAPNDNSLKKNIKNKEFSITDKNLDFEKNFKLQNAKVKNSENIVHALQIEKKI